MFDVFGNVIDRGAALSDFQLRSVHQAPPPLARRSTESDIFETGIMLRDHWPRIARWISARRRSRRCDIPDVLNS
jgi:F0F1-type ATP synthase beta subunit